jgi:uncharacterized GH25 family protein
VNLEATTIMRPRRLKWLVALGLALAALPLFAHDVWIEPSSFAPGPDQTVGLRLRVGQDLQGEPLALVDGMVRQFVVHDATASRPVVIRQRAETAALMRVTTPGLQVVGYYSNPSFIELPAEKFNAYLADEGLDAILSRRAQLNQSSANGREMFSRCAKTLLRSGSASDSQHDQRLGFPLELVAERNPYTIAAGQALPVRLTYQDRPLAGALVVAVNSLDAAQKQSARTDSNGRVQFWLHPGGMWLIKAVHMVPAPAGAAADWASHWASLTFEGGDPAAAR